MDKAARLRDLARQVGDKYHEALAAVDQANQLILAYNAELARVKKESLETAALWPTYQPVPEPELKVYKR